MRLQFKWTLNDIESKLKTKINRNMQSQFINYHHSYTVLQFFHYLHKKNSHDYTRLCTYVITVL